jgi:UPF0716 family protein affecting phage T7 exclusion
MHVERIAYNLIFVLIAHVCFNIPGLCFGLIGALFLILPRLAWTDQIPMYSSRTVFSGQLVWRWITETNASTGLTPSIISSSPSTWTDQTDEYFDFVLSKLLHLIFLSAFLSMS